MDDQQIISLYNQRSEQAIVASQMKYGVYCQSIAYNILRQAEDSEECVNDTWLYTWNAIPPEQPNNLKAYLGKITRNLALTRYRDQHSLKRGGGNVDLALSELQDCIAGAPTPEEHLLDGMLEDSINRFLDKLPKEKRVVFVLRYHYLYTTREISETVGIRESTVKSMLFRLRKQLKTHLRQEGIYHEE